MDEEEEVFVDAEEEEVTPRRSARKRRSTAGSCSTAGTKKQRTLRKMPVGRSPSKDQAASPAGDKPHPPPTATTDPEAFWRKLGGMLGGMEARLKQETATVKDELGGVIGDLGKRVEKNERRLDGLVEEVHRIVDSKIASSNASNLSDDPSTRPPDPSSFASVVARGQLGTGSKIKTAKRSEDEYWRCRHSLRIRPIPAGNDDSQVRHYMATYLKLDEDFLECMGHINIRRVPHGPAAKIKNEAIVTFETVETRDIVRRAARNLAGQGQEYGVRLEIPDRMKTDMNALQAVSFEIRQKFPTSRRNVLFEDETQSLVLDFCTGEGEKWRRITSSQARERKKRSASKLTLDTRLDLDDGEINKILDTSGGPTTVNLE